MDIFLPVKTALDTVVYKLKPHVSSHRVRRELYNVNITVEPLNDEIAW